MSAGVLSRVALNGALPVTQLSINGRDCRAVVDSGCTENMIFAPYCEQWRKHRVNVMSMSGDSFVCDGSGSVYVTTMTGQSAVMNVLVVSERPLGVEFVLGVSGISALGGVMIGSPSDVRFCGAVSRQCVQPAVDAPDFEAQFDPVARAWTVAWKWRDGAAPECLTNGVAEYAVSESDRGEFDAELQSWIRNGWLVPYDETVCGPPRGLIPLMAVEQRNKTKIRPVLDYRELNSHVVPHTADADVCADTLRKWRRHGSNIAVIDLKRAYLQLRTKQHLWPFQTVMVNGQLHALTRVGFGLSVAPVMMKAVVNAVLQQDPVMKRAVLPYVDDLCVNLDLVSAEQVIAHFERYGLQCKPPERAKDGARMLGLRVRADGGGTVRWERDNDVGAPPVTLTRRSVFAWCGRLVAHLPVCGWLRPATAWLKRRVNALTSSWDQPTDDAALREEVDWVASRLASEDPARGRWDVGGDRAVVWTDASSVAAGVVLATPAGDVIEDACWLRRDETAHINMAELDAAVRGLNLAIAWGMRCVELVTDSSTVHRWISDALSGRARLRTKAHGEMVIRRRIDLVKQLVDEFSMELSVTLVPSAQNRADSLTRVPAEWVRSDSCVPQPVAAAAAADLVSGNARDCDSDVIASEVDSAGNGDQTLPIAEVHGQAGHPGIRRTLYFARRNISPAITRAQVQRVVKACDVCQAVDPAPAKWRHGVLSVPQTWQRIAIDITHHDGQSYLSVIDCGPSRFAVWRPLRRQDSACVVQRLEEIFYERGAPAEILCDNDPVFRGRPFAVLTARWRVTVRYRAAHVPSGNGVVERSHRTIKVIAARKRCSVAEAVHLYNVTPREGERDDSAPFCGVHTYEPRDCVTMADGSTERTEAREAQLPAVEPDGYAVGDLVWVRRSGTRCTEQSGRGTVTAVVSPQVVEVDGMPRHVRDLRRRSSELPVENHASDEPLYVMAPPPNPIADQSDVCDAPQCDPPVEPRRAKSLVGVPRRSERLRMLALRQAAPEIPVGVQETGDH